MIVNLLHGFDVHEALYLNFEINDPWIRDSGPRAGPVLPYSKHILNPKQ